MANPQKASPGTHYTIKFDGDGRRVEPRSYTVQPRQDSCNSLGGVWHCVTHQCHFDNQLQKDIHISSENRKTKCVLAWFCLEHGAAEEP